MLNNSPFLTIFSYFQPFYVTHGLHSPNYAWYKQNHWIIKKDTELALSIWFSLTSVFLHSWRALDSPKVPSTPPCHKIRGLMRCRHWLAIQPRWISRGVSPNSSPQRGSSDGALPGEGALKIPWTHTAKTLLQVNGRATVMKGHNRDCNTQCDTTVCIARPQLEG